ncbi:MAG TPA: hypothetical protein VG410_10345 [Solirubrobacteraceae bacterium]|nr:hypothetical protein [Solirubrobacteraceae bacterium]
MERARDVAVTIRYAFPDDERPLGRLAALDSALTPSAPILVAEVEGQLRAALSLATWETIADPFHPSTALIELLVARAQQLTSERRRIAVRFGPRSPLRLALDAQVRARRAVQSHR